MKFVFNVPDVSCGHCKARIENALNGNENVTFSNVDIDKKEVTVESDLSSETLITLIDEAGYDAVLQP